MSKKNIFLLAIIFLVFQSCSDSLRDEDVSTIAAKEALMAKTFALNVFQEIYFYAGNDSIYETNYNIRPKNSCVKSISLIKEDETFPYTLNMEFVQGSTTCDLNSRIAGGRIKTTIVGQPAILNSTIVADFDSLKIDNFYISGRLNLTLLQAGGIRKYDIDISNLTIRNDTTNALFNFNGKLDVWAGLIFNFANIYMEMSGNGSGQSSKGSSYTTKTLSSMRTNFGGNCKLWHQIDFEVNAPTLEPRFVTRHNNNCNNASATILIAGRKYNFFVP